MDLRAEGASLADAFGRIALALFAAVVDPASVEDREVREVRAHGSDLRALLLRWLEECLYVHEVEGFGCRAIEFTVFQGVATGGGEPLRLHAFLHGEPIDPARHRLRETLRGISSDGLLVEASDGSYRVRAATES